MVRPVDADTIVASVEKTGRALVLEEGPRTGGWAGEVLAIVAEQALDRRAGEIAGRHRRLGGARRAIHA